MDNKNHTTFFILIKAVKNVNKNKAVKPSKKMYITEHRLQKLVKTKNNNQGTQPKKVVKTTTLQNWLS